MATKTDNLYAMRHSLAHIMATAIQELWPETKFGVGPVIDNGFYYDFDAGRPVNLEELKKIEAKMREVIKKDYKFECIEMPIDEAIRKVKKEKQDYKVDLLSDLQKHGTTNLKDINNDVLGTKTNDAKNTTVTFYRDGPFEDLCHGPHVGSTGEVGPFKLTKMSGVYWRGDEKNPQLQRIYGVAFETQADLDNYFEMLAEAEKRDHRKLGRDLDLFVFSDLVGAGLPMWTPRGTTLRTELDRYVQELRSDYDFQAVTIPHITKKELYEKSGHWDKFKDELFQIQTREGHTFVMKPMNCPHHAQIYDSRPRSYRDLPIRYRETTMVYRDEQSGELSGLSRVRSITQDDAHVFCRTAQVQQEVLNIWSIVESYWKTFGIELTVRLSTHDPDNMSGYLGDVGKWDDAVAQLKAVIEKKGVKYIDGVGEAAFYGPKIDFMGRDVIGREFQASTIQLDFGQPEGFDLTCTNEQGEDERIVMIHCAITGSLERSLVLLIEHYAGAFPVWLAPEQVRLVTVNDTKEMIKLADKYGKKMKDAGLRSTIDASSESVGKKIREAGVWKVPYTLVLGEKELKHGIVTPRIRADLIKTEPQPIEIDAFITAVAGEIQSRASKTSL